MSFFLSKYFCMLSEIPLSQIKFIPVINYFSCNILILDILSKTNLNLVCKLHLYSSETNYCFDRVVHFNTRSEEGCFSKVLINLEYGI